jgi:hypothetical protein
MSTITFVAMPKCNIYWMCHYIPPGAVPGATRFPILLIFHLFAKPENSLS